MFTFKAERWVPKFILDDTNGYAVAKAIEAAMQALNGVVAQGLACIYDFDTMPEWRLDELAWETNCLYDYNAGVEAKRIWIKNAIPYYRLFGTPQAVYKFLSGYFDGVELEENWNYGADPFHFRVTVDGTWTPENEAWARRAIAAAKNVRSVLDALRIGCKCSIGITAEGAVLGRFSYPLTGAENWAGRWPQTNTLGILDESGKAAVEATATPRAFPYPLTGTTPEINTLGVIDETGKAGMEATATPRAFPYPLAGTAPEINTLGVVDAAHAGVSADAEGHRFPYQMTSENTQAGTIPQENTLGVVGENDIEAAQADDTYAMILYKLCGQDEI